MLSKITLLGALCLFGLAYAKEDCLGVDDVRNGRFKRTLTGPLTLYYPQKFPKGKITNIELKTISRGTVSLMGGTMQDNMFKVDVLMTQNVSAVGYISFPLSVITNEEGDGFSLSFNEQGTFPIPYRFAFGGVKVLIRRTAQNYVEGQVIPFNSQIFAEFPVRVCVDTAIVTHPPMRTGCVGTSTPVEDSYFRFKLRKLNALMVNQTLTVGTLSSLKLKVAGAGNVYIYLAEPVGQKSYRIVSSLNSPVTGPRLIEMATRLPVTSSNTKLIIASDTNEDFPIRYSFSTVKNILTHSGGHLPPYYIGHVITFDKNAYAEIPLLFCT